MSKSDFNSFRSAAEHDYAKFYEQWENRIRNIVVGSREIQFCDVDDVVQDLMTDFYANDGLSEFDSERGTKLSTWVYGFVGKRLLGKRDKALRKTFHEGHSLSEHFDAERDNNFLGFSLISEPESSVDFMDMVTRIYKQLKKDKEEVEAFRQRPLLPINDFPRLFSCLVQQVMYGPAPATVEALGVKQACSQGRYGISRKALAYELNLSDSAVSVMLTRLAKIPAVAELMGD